VFGPEYTDQPAEFARRFFRTYFHNLKRARLIVIDDLHHGRPRVNEEGVARDNMLEIPEVGRYGGPLPRGFLD
jgi:hypothetical protein